LPRGTGLAGPEGVDDPCRRPAWPGGQLRRMRVGYEVQGPMAASQSQQTRKIIVEPTGRDATGRVAELLKSAICDVVGRDDLCLVALAGGTTPHMLYESLAREGTSGLVPWQDLEVFFGDERDVGQDHIESNYNMVQRTMLDHLPIQPQRVHPMPADSDDLEAAAAEYEQTIRRIVPLGPDGLPRFDLILLGMGGDGHVASLFPGTEVLSETRKLVAAYFVPVLGRYRMTFTFGLINAARMVILLVTGADKAEAVAGMLSDCPPPVEQLPGVGVAPADGQYIVVLDADAARLAGLKAQ